MKDAKEIAREVVCAHVVVAPHRACEGCITTLAAAIEQARKDGAAEEREVLLHEVRKMIRNTSRETAGGMIYAGDYAGLHEAYEMIRARGKEKG